MSNFKPNCRHYDALFSLDARAEAKHNIRVDLIEMNLINEEDCKKYVEEFKKAISFYNFSPYSKGSMNFVMSKDFDPHWLNQLVQRLIQLEDVRLVIRSPERNDYIVVRTYSNFDIIGLFTNPDKRIDCAVIQCNQIYTDKKEKKQKRGVKRKDSTQEDQIVRYKA